MLGWLSSSKQTRRRRTYPLLLPITRTYFVRGTSVRDNVNAAHDDERSYNAMSTVYPIEISPSNVKNIASLLRIVALALISGAAVASRLFAVINFESIIHELYVWQIYRFFMLWKSCKAIHGSISEWFCWSN